MKLIIGSLAQISKKISVCETDRFEIYILAIFTHISKEYKSMSLYTRIKNKTL